MKIQDHHEQAKGKVGAFKECIVFLTLLSFLLQPMLVMADGPIADPNGGANRPRIDTTANGIPLVQITNPSAAGVSRNKYTQYNVDPHGVILNNSVGVALTQQGGYVPGNPYLTTGPAKIILNEVTGSGRSMLNGFTEVAGQRADVVIANPNGITCNGCGFINTGRGVLTTGTPVFGGSGSLDAFRVTGGDVSIQGAGLDARGADVLDIITRSVSVNTTANSGIWANELNVITGSNLVSYGDLTAQLIAADDPTPPSFSIDVAALGGMYANKIRLVSTEAGVGVRNSGAIVSNADFTLTSGGQIVNNALMFADQLTMTGTSLVNDGPEAVIATRNENGAARFFLSDSLFNNNNAWIYSMGDIVIAGSDNGDGTYTNAASILNQSATIEAARDVTIAADTVTNQKQIFVTAEIVDPSYTTHFNGAIDIPEPHGIHGAVAGYISASADYTSTTTVTRVTLDSTVGQILAGRDMRIAATDLNNVYSTIAAGNNLDLTVTGTLSNVGRAGYNVQTDSGSQYLVSTWYEEHCDFFSCWSNWPVGGVTLPYLVSHTPTLSVPELREGASNISAGNVLTASVGSFQNITLGPGPSSSSSTSLTAGSAAVVSGAAITPTFNTTPPGGIFVTNPNPTGPLIETDPRFTNLRLFMSSDYMLARLGYDPTLTQKRLGDGFYEQKLVTDEITHATGRRFLSNYASAEEQYLALMEAGVTYAQQFNLTVGVGLTSAQMAQLTSDMVWLVEKTVNGQKVLAPVVYLSKLHANDLAGSGAVMAARDINLMASNDLANSGIIKAGYRNQIFASNITNIGGVIDAGGNTELTAAKDIINRSGTISGGNVALSAGRDIKNETAIQTESYADGAGSYTRVGKQGTIASTGDLSVSAGRDFTIAGANVTAAGDGDINAGRNLTIAAVETKDRLAVAFNGLSYSRDNTTNIVSNITTGNNLTMTAGNNASLAGAQVVAGNDLSLKAGGDVSITEVKDRTHYESNLNFGKSGYLKTKKIDEKVIGSSISAGGNVNIEATGQSQNANSAIEAQRFHATAGREFAARRASDRIAIDDGNRLGYIAPPVLIKTEQPAPVQRGSILIQGSSITSKSGSVNLNAKKDITIQEAREYHEDLRDSQQSFDGGMLYGSSRTTTHDLVTQDLAKRSAISGGNVTAQSEGNITLQGNSMNGSGDVTLIAKGNVAVTEARDYTYEEHQREEVNKGGMVDSLKAGLKMMTSAPSGAESMAGIAPKNTTSFVKSTTKDETVKSSDIEAKGNVTILAGRFDQPAAQPTCDTPPADPNSGNILVRGSNIITDAGAITLAAKNNVTVREAREVHEYNMNSYENTKRFDANTSVTKRQIGKQDLAAGSTLSGDTVTAVSAKDTTIQGSNVLGTGTVTLAAGENLNIVTAQETDHQEFDAKMTRFGVSVNFNKGKGTYGYSVGTNTQHNNELYDSVNNVGSMVGSMSGDVDLSAGKDLTILGSQVLGKGNVGLAAGENVSILSAENTSSMVQTSHSKFTGYTYTAHASGMSSQHTWGSDRSHSDQSGSSKTNVASTVGSHAGSVAINAGKDARIKASNVFSDKSTDIAAQNVTVEAGYDTMDGHVSSEKRIEQLALSFKMQFTANGKNVADTWQQSNNAKDQRAKYMYRYQAISSMMNGPVGVGVSLSLSYNTSRQQSSQDYHQAYAVGSNILSNNDINIFAIGGKEKKDGDITFIGSSAQAKNIMLDAARDISLLAAKNTSDNNTTFGANESSIALTVAVQANSNVNANDRSGKSDNSGSSVGASISLSGSTNASTAEMSGRDTTHVATQIAAAEKLILISGRDTNLKGAQASAETIKANIGRNLNLESLQDSSIYRGRDENQGGSFSISYGKGVSTGAGGSSNNSSSWGVSGSYTFVQGRTDSEYSAVNQQTGLFARKGGYDIHVGENTDLKGAVIASRAHAKKNRLSTKTLTYSDVHNKAEYSSSKYGGTISAGYSSGKTTNSSTGETKPTGGTSVGVSPIIAMPSGGDAASRTRSAISAGTIEVRGDKNQNLASLSRDTDNAHQALGKIFDLEKIQRQQETAQAFGQVANQAVGDLAKALTQNYENAKKERAAAEYDAARAKANNDQDGYDSAKLRMAAADAYLKENQAMYDVWKDGGLGKIALHTIVGGVQAGLGGGNIAAGALGGLTNEALIGHLGTYLQEKGIDPRSEHYKSIMQVASAAVGAGVGAIVSNGSMQGIGSGAATALDAEKYNRQLHQSEIERIKVLAKKFAQEQNEQGNNINEKEAEDRLMLQALKQTDKSWNDFQKFNDQAALDFLTKNSGIFTVDGEKYNYFFAKDINEWRDMTLFSDTISKYGAQYENAKKLGLDTEAAINRMSLIDEGAGLYTGLLRGGGQSIIDAVKGGWELVKLREELKQNDPVGLEKVDAMSKGLVEFVSAPGTSINRYFTDQQDYADMLKAQGKYDESIAVTTETYITVLGAFLGGKAAVEKVGGLAGKAALKASAAEGKTLANAGKLAEDVPKGLIKWDQNSQRWKDVATGRYTEGPEMPQGFGKPSTWTETTKDVSQEMLKIKQGEKMYEIMKSSSEAENLRDAIEAALKNKSK